ncbi:MAG TPA: hypothetical protein VGU25_02110 [Acidobacteriaceae bacterium]|nr:hypothetical protein [Acidobacteriaceae bacterium]
MNNMDNKLTPPRGPMTDDARLTAALEHKPELQIPADFAAKVAALAVAQPPRRRRIVPQFGSLIALLSVPVAALALFALALHATPNLHSLSFDIELALLAELGIIGCWLSQTFSSRLSR